MISISTFIFPFVINGFYWFNAECRFTLYVASENCSSFRFTNNLVSSIVNIFLAILTFNIIVGAVLYSRKQFTNLTSQTLRAERKLVTQTLVSSIFLALLYLTIFISSYFEQNLSIYFIMESLSTVLFFLHHIPGMISLFVVSPVFRQRFAEFYRVDKCCFCYPCWKSKVQVGSSK